MERTNITADIEETTYVGYKEDIGYFNASMPRATYDRDRIFTLVHFMRVHKVTMQKSNDDPKDNWYLFILPRGSTKAPVKERTRIPRYTVHLPDGFTFELEQGPLSREGFFASPIRINLRNVEVKKEAGRPFHAQKSGVT